MSVWFPWKLQFYGNVTRIHVSLFKELRVFSPLGLKPRDWGILQCSCYRWLWHNLLYNEREAWKRRDFQVREKSIETMLRVCHLPFPEEDFGQSCLRTQVTVLQAAELRGPACLHTQAFEGLPGALPPDTPLTSEHWSQGEPFSYCSLFPTTQLVSHTSSKVIFNYILSISVFTNSDTGMSLWLQEISFS